MDPQENNLSTLFVSPACSTNQCLHTKVELRGEICITKEKYSISCNFGKSQCSSEVVRSLKVYILLCILLCECAVVYTVFLYLIVKSKLRKLKVWINRLYWISITWVLASCHLTLFAHLCLYSYTFFYISNNFFIFYIW